MRLLKNKFDAEIRKGNLSKIHPVITMFLAVLAISLTRQTVMKD